MAFSKVTLNGTTLMDVTQDTVDEDNLLLGATATKANGIRTTGTFPQVTTGTASIYNNRLNPNNFNVMVRKQGNIVVVRAEVYKDANATLAAYGTGFLIEEGFRPQELTYFAGVYGTSVLPFVITTAGGWQSVVEITGTSRIAFAVSYVVA